MLGFVFSVPANTLTGKSIPEMTYFCRVGHKTAQSINSTFPQSEFNSLTFPGFLYKWSPCINYKQLHLPCSKCRVIY